MQHIFSRRFFNRLVGTNVSSFISRNVRLLGVALLLPMLLTGLQAQTAHFSWVQAGLVSGLSGPTGIAVDTGGNVYVADTGDTGVKEIPPGCASSGCLNMLGSGFSGPSGVAVDASGNVYVADTGNGVVKEMVAVGGSIPATPTINTLGGGFTAPYGVAVDGSGNVYVSDTGIGIDTVSEIPAGCASAACVVTLGGGFSVPYGIAVDGSGNVYVADKVGSAVKEIPAGCTTAGCVVTLGGGFSGPQGVAVDGSGYVWVADSSGNAVKEIPPGCTSSGCVVGLGSGFNGPSGVAVDGSGNVYAADTGNSQVVKLETESVDFGTVAIAQASAKISLTFTFDSGGSIGKPVVLTQSVAGLDFADAGTGSCTTNGTSHTYGAGDICTVDVSFTPAVAGLRYGAVELQTNLGATIATGNVHGAGSGPQVSFLPGSQSTLGGGFSAPPGVAVDGSGNVFVADSGNNVVQEIPAGCANSSCVIPLGGSFVFSAPYYVALDGSGNVFVGDSSNNLVEEVLAAGSYTVVNPLGSGFNKPQGVAVDGAGNVFVADTNNNQVREILAVGGSIPASPTILTLGGGFTYPLDVAVDELGNVFATDPFNNNAVKEIPPGCTSESCVITLGSGFSLPFGVAVDGAGNVFVADTGNGAVKEILAAGGYITINTLASGFNNPTGVAVDGFGNVYVADRDNNRVVKLDFADAPTLSFATATDVGSADSTDGPQTVTVQNIGNAQLTFQPFVAANLLDAILTPSGATDCTALSGLQLAPGVSCTLAIEFEPAVAGSPVTGYVDVVDNALNAVSPNYATQSIVVQGTGVGGTTSQTINFPNPGTQTYGVAPFALTATASSGLAVSYAVISGPASVSIIGTLTITGAGSVTVQATQGGDGTYAAATPVNMTFMVSAEALTVTGLVANSKTYDGTTAATLSGTSSLVGVVSGDTVSLSGTAVGTFASPGVGTGIAVNITGLSLSGGSVANYTLTAPTATANISPATLTVAGLVANSKTYDGTTAATLSGTSSLVGAVSGDTVSLSGTAVGTFASPGVGTGIAVNITGLSLNGGSVANYTLTAPASSANITAKALTVAGLVANSKTYDGTTAATLSGTASLVGVVSGDTVTLAGTAVGTFASPGVGTGIAVNITGLSLSGGSVANYTLTAPVSSANITAKALTVAGLVANSKTYDGTTAATLSGTASLVGVVSGDTVTLAGTAVGTFASPGVGTGIAVNITGLSLNGGSVANYTLTAPASSANITAKALTVAGLVANSKTYDGTTAATLSGTSSLVGVVSGDTVSLSGTAVGTFASPGVGTGIAVNITGLSLNGGSVANYTLTQPTSSANITAKALTVAGLVANSKTYDGTTAATLSGTSSVVGVVSGDTVSLSGTAVGTFASPGVGTGIAVNITGLSLSGGSVANYTLTQPTSSANITAKALTVAGLVANSKTYDGTTSATLSGTSSVVGVVSGDTVSLSGTAVGTFASPGVGTGIAVNITGLSLNGGSVANYTLTQPASSANITAKALTVAGLVANSKTYDGTTAATVSGTASLVGVVSGDTVSLSGTAVGTFASPGVGTGIGVNITGLSLSGGSVANYTLTQPTSSANISPAVLTVTANNASMVSGQALPSFSYTITGYVNGDTSTVVSGTATLTTTATSNSPAGSYPITFATELLTASNYTFSYASGTLTISSAGSANYNLTANPTTLSIPQGQSGTTTITLTGSNGYDGTVSFSCGSLPAGMSCSFTKSSLTAPTDGSAVTTVLTVTTSAASARLNRNSSRPLVAATLTMGFGIFGFVLAGGGARRKRLWMIGLMVLSMALVFTMTGCGSGSSRGGTPVGSSTITVTAVASANGIQPAMPTQTLSITVNVTQ